MAHRTPLRAHHALMQEESQKELLTLTTLPESTRELINMALDIRNKERILEGQPKYESVEAMVRPDSVMLRARPGPLERAQRLIIVCHAFGVCAGRLVHGIRGRGKRHVQR